jgi:16S rRNA (guanine(966)-N(2))-methyltransferase RsmD
MPIRVIAGTAKGRKLKMVPGSSTRPVMDRVKEALFNILGQGVVDSTFLDLFAGTGSVGIEALSRGAALARFVENHPLAVRTIHENLAHTRLANRAQVLRANVFVYLPFEYIYVAPPQYLGLWKETLLLLDENPEHVQEDGIVIVQIDPRERQEVSLQHLQPYDARIYGKTMLWFFERVSTG